MATLTNLTLVSVTDRKTSEFKFEHYYGEPCEVVFLYFGDSMKIRFKDSVIETSWVVKPLARKGQHLFITTMNSVYCFSMTNKKLGL